MPKILLLSDTHSDIDPTVLKRAREVDQVWHAGDIGAITVTESLKQCAPLKAVYGNIDNAHIQAEFPKDLFFDCHGIKVYITHIAGYLGRYNFATKKAIETHKPDLVICGHSHILKVMRDPKYGHLHMNPGAIGRHGFHKARTMLRFSIEAGQIKDLEVLEYKR
jgi:putative phosphoesterase